jgi:nucleoside-diphosphate-sugar epimerase
MPAHFTQTIALVTGATNQIGHFLLPRLQAAGFRVIAISRAPIPSSAQGIMWQQLDLHTQALPPVAPSVLFHLAPLTLLPKLLAELPNPLPIQRVIAFSSTSCFTKIDSSDPKEREIVQGLNDAELALAKVCRERQIAWTVFRPTLIYGAGKDKNISFIAQFIQRFGFFPLLAGGEGLRQPVHADDLAAACVQAYAEEATYNRAYNLSGGQTLSYRAMVEGVFHSLCKPPRIISIPEQVFKLGVTMARKLPRFRHLSPAMLDRMNQDLCFDHKPATEDFGYRPRPFHASDLGLSAKPVNLLQAKSKQNAG